MASGGDPRRGDPRRIHRRPSRARSASPPPAHGGARAISQAARSSRAEVAPVSVRGCSVPPRRGDGGVSWRPRLESLRVATLMEDHGQTQAKMVHPQLRALLSHAMSRMNRAVLIDGAVLDELLQQISDALLQADFSLEMVSRMVSELRSKVSAMDLVASGSKHQIYQAINKALCRLIDSGKKPDFVPKKGKSCVILFIGLKGSGKTSSCAKFAYYHQHKGFSPSLVCANTSGNQPFHQLKQMAQQANIPCYGSHTEPDPVKIAVRYVEKMRKVNSDLIIIDTRGGHMSDESFFPEICNIEKATKPDLVILVVDAGGGRFSLDQAQTFKRKIPVGSVMITKMDDHSKGAGALNALAAAKLPVILFGTGKRMQDFETFDVKLFVNHLLDNKARVLAIDTEDMHRLFDNLKVSNTERKSAIEEVKQECWNAYNVVLEKHKLLAQQICILESKYKILCDVLGELKNTDIQAATTLEERHNLVLMSLKSLEKEKNSRTKALQVLLSKALSLCEFLGVTTSEPRTYKYMLENMHSYVKEVNSLSTESLEKLTTRVKELEVNKAGKIEEVSAKRKPLEINLEHADQSKKHILRQGLIYIRRADGRADLSGLKDLIRMTDEWQSRHHQVILYEEKSLLAELMDIEDSLSRLNPDTSGHVMAKSDTEMGHSSSSSGMGYTSSSGGRSSSDMEQSGSSGGRSSSEMEQSSSSSARSDLNDPEYMPESSESDISMGALVSESSDSLED